LSAGKRLIKCIFKIRNGKFHACGAHSKQTSDVCDLSSVVIAAYLQTRNPPPTTYIHSYFIYIRQIFCDGRIQICVIFTDWRVCVTGHIFLAFLRISPEMKSHVLMQSHAFLKCLINSFTFTSESRM
jgi:hypothetical protein